MTIDEEKLTNDISSRYSQKYARLNRQTTNNIATELTNHVNNQSLIPSTDAIRLTLTLEMTTAQAVETSVTVNNNSPIQDYVHPDDHAKPTYEMTSGFKPFTILHSKYLLFLNNTDR